MIITVILEQNFLPSSPLKERKKTTRRCVRLLFIPSSPLQRSQKMKSFLQPISQHVSISDFETKKERTDVDTNANHFRRPMRLIEMAD